RGRPLDGGGRHARRALRSGRPQRPRPVRGAARRRAAAARPDRLSRAVRQVFRNRAAHAPSEGWTSGEQWFIVGESGRYGQGPTMLLGAYEHTIDDKNRLTLPARFRHVFGDGIVVTRGMDGCLFAYTRDDWDRLVQGRLATL